MEIQGSAGQVLAAIEREYSASPECYPPHKLDLGIQGNFRRFMVGRMGSTGSTWLAKLLNSHPEAYCSHEEIISQIYPSNHYGADEVIRFLRFFAWDTKHNAYRAVGDVGSTWIRYLPYLPFTTALLVRHPAKMLNTWMRLYSKDRSYTPEMTEAVGRCLQRVWGIDPWQYDLVDRDFLHHSFHYVFQLSVLPHVHVLVRIEDMADATHTHSVLTTLTGLRYDAETVDNALRNRVNQRAAPARVREIVEGFSPRQREWYRVMIRDAAQAIDYDWMEEAQPSAMAAPRQTSVSRRALT